MKGSIEQFGRFSSRAAWMAYSKGAATMPEGKDYMARLRQLSGGTEIVVTQTPKAKLIAASKRHYQPAPLKDDYRVTVGQGETLEQTVMREMEAIEEKQRDNVSRATRRASQRLRWLVKALGADHLLTLTYRECVIDRERLKNDWQAFVRLVKAKYPEWSFVAVVEEQERGALHIHAAVVGRQDVKYLRRCWYKALGSSPEASGADTPGQIDVRAPSKRWGGKTYKWDSDKLAGYLTKYMRKAFADSEKNSKRYWATKGIDVPVKKIWLGAASFAEAIVEAHDIMRELGIKKMSMWASEGYDAIWISGS